MNFESFHFLRPAWLLALAVLIPVLGLAWRRRNASGWERICEPHLLPHLLAAGGAGRPYLAMAAFAFGWAGACLALAGPTWERLPQPAFSDPSRTVFVVGLAPSMDARDVAPSRMARARHKLHDALDRLSGGSAALVVYREEAFAATPLTDDLQVLREIVPLIETSLAPGRRVLPARGIEQAVALLEPVGLTGADLLLVTDGTDDDPDATRAAAAAAARRGARVSVLAIAGAAGGELEEIASAGGGAFATLTADDRDLAQIQRAGDLPLGAPLSKSDRLADDWRDAGAWLVWLPLLLAPLAFRKGWATAVLAVLCLQLPAGTAQAGVAEWFARPDQRGARAFAEEQYEASAAAFEDPAWRAAAQYRAGDFEAAAAQLADRSDPDSSYNRGNALARAGRLQEALAAYDAALAARPEDADARFNRDLVARLLEQQKPPPKDDAAESKASQESKESQGGDADQKASSGSADSANPPDAGSEPGEQEQAGAEGESKAEPSRADDATGEQPPDANADAGEQQAPPEQAEATAGADAPEAAAEHAEADAQGGAAAEPGEREGAGDASGSPETASGPAGPGAPPPAGNAAPMSPEEQRAARWMARLPDDPGGLLREKIRRDYLRKAVARQQGGQP